MREDRCGHWAKTIAEQEASSLSVPAFCHKLARAPVPSIIGGDGCERAKPGAFCAGRNETGAGLRSGSGTDFRRWRTAAHRPGCRRRHAAPGPGCGSRMIHLPASVRVYLCLSPVTCGEALMGCTRWWGAAAIWMLSPDILSFCQPSPRPPEVLYWDRDGFAVWAKRLEEGTYAIPSGRAARRGASK